MHVSHTEMHTPKISVQSEFIFPLIPADVTNSTKQGPPDHTGSRHFDKLALNLFLVDPKYRPEFISQLFTLLRNWFVMDVLIQY